MGDTENGNKILKKINPEYITRKWDNKNLKYYGDFKEKEEYRFYTFTKNEHIEICPTLLTGTDHVKYIDMQWISMLGSLKGKKGWTNLTKEEALSAILTPETGDTIDIHKYGDEYFICDGNHRCCYAKFLELEKILVTLKCHSFDNKSHNLYSKLKKHFDMTLTTFFDGKYYGINLEGENYFISKKDNLIEAFFDYYCCLPSINIFTLCYYKVIKIFHPHDKHIESLKDLGRIKTVCKIHKFLHKTSSRNTLQIDGNA